MNCKNCQYLLVKESQFCDNCGAKVVKSRITFKLLTTDFFINVFGVDSKFFLTLKKMITHPNEVLNEYISGVRKRYVNPFAFLAIAAGLSLIIFNYFADDFIDFNASVNSSQIDKLKKITDRDLTKLEGLSEKELIKLKAEKKGAEFQLKFLDSMMKFMLHYYNLLTFVFLFIYAILSKWTYRKPHNFGEHLIFNAYIYGFTSYFSLIAFLLAVFIHPSIYTYSIIGYLFYYLYVFGKLYNFSVYKSIIKLLRFFFGLLLFFLTLIILIFIVTFLLSKMGLIKFT